MVVRLGLVRSITLCIAVGAVMILTGSSGHPASVKDTFEKYNLLGTLASDCSKPADPKTPYLLNRAIDADHVQVDRMTGPSSRDAVIMVDKALESKPNEITLSATIDDQQYTQVLQVEHDRMRTVESTRASGEKDISGGHYTKGGAETPWFGRCLQKVTIHNSPPGGKCIEPLNGEIKAGVHLQMWDCNDTPPQIFAFDTLTGWLTIGDLCVDTDGSSGQRGVRLPLAPCNGGSSQVWKTESIGDYVKIVGINGFCVDVSNSSRNNRAAVGLWNCSGQSNQSWELHPALNLTLEPAVDRAGNHIDEFDLAAADVALCQAACIETRQCAAWVYRKPEGRTNHAPHCWLLDKTTKVTTGDGMLASGTVRPEPK
jgi:hypothetical protein